MEKTIKRGIVEQSLGLKFRSDKEVLTFEMTGSWSFYAENFPYQLIWYEILVFQFPNNTAPQFLSLFKKVVWNQIYDS